MDLQKIDDIKELKALAYDQFLNKQIAEQNLIAINQRINEIESKKENSDKKTR